MKMNKKVIALMLAALISITVVGCTKCISDEEVATTATLESFEEVLPQTFDSGKGTCIIVLPRSLQQGGRGIEAMIHLGKQKEKWLKKFPQKEITSWTAITHSYSRGGVALTTGILIHYQSKEREYL